MAVKNTTKTSSTPRPRAQSRPNPHKKPRKKTKKKKNNILKKKTNDDTIPFHLIDKEKIYHNLVKYMYGNVPHKKSKRNKSTQH